MLRVHPVPEQEATGEIRELFADIKQLVGSESVPVIFQYLAAFPDYLSFLWQQARRNLANRQFQQQSEEIITFAQTATKTCYVPAAATVSYVEQLRSGPEYEQLQQFVSHLLQTNAILYLLAISVRESLKGKYLGLQQLSVQLSDDEKKQFFSVAAPFAEYQSPIGSLDQKPTETSLRLHAHSQGLVTTSYGKFFARMEKEMKALIKQETYLYRRVELERFSLAKLNLLPFPLDSSFVEVTRRSADHPHFSDLLYLLSDVFPTETPYKLFSACVMDSAIHPTPVRPGGSTALARS